MKGVQHEKHVLAMKYMCESEELMKYMCWRCRMISNVVKGFSIKNACDDCKNHPANKGVKNW
jgi:hypothetical protein